MLKIDSFNTSGISYRGKTRDLLIARKYASPRLMLSRAVRDNAINTPKADKKQSLKTCISYLKKQLSGNKKAGKE